MEKPKSIADVGVFATTAVWSIFAYVWLFCCLSVFSYGEVTVLEAWLTLVFFIILLLMAYGMDRLNASRIAEEEEADKAVDEERKILKSKLRGFARDLNDDGNGDKIMIEVVQGVKNLYTEKVSSADKQTIKGLFKEILEVDDVSKVGVADLAECLQPDSMFERFAARKACGAAAGRDFLDIKGTKGQVENNSGKNILNANPHIGFRCLHYSVAESAGVVKLCILKKPEVSEYTFGVRAIPDTAKEGTEFGHFEEIITMKRSDQETFVEVKIIDNH